MYYNIEDIEGIGPVYTGQLASAGIATTEDLLDLCADPDGRDAVVEATGLSMEQVLKWANLADLMRINGIGPQFSELLEAAGVDTVKELQHRNAENLAVTMDHVNNEQGLTRVTPATTTIAKWVRLAQSTEPRITH